MMTGTGGFSPGTRKKSDRFSTSCQAEESKKDTTIITCPSKFFPPPLKSQIPICDELRFYTQFPRADFIRLDQ